MSKHIQDLRIYLLTNWNVPFASAYSGHQDVEGYLPYLYIVITFRYQKSLRHDLQENHGKSLTILLISACKPTQTWTPRLVIPISAQKAITCFWPLLETCLSQSMSHLRLSCSLVLADGGSIFFMNRNLCPTSSKKLTVYHLCFCDDGHCAAKGKSKIVW